jgi:hypothetical protein
MVAMRVADCSMVVFCRVRECLIRLFSVMTPAERVDPLTNWNAGSSLVLGVKNMYGFQDPASTPRHTDIRIPENKNQESIPEESSRDVKPGPL